MFERRCLSAWNGFFVASVREVEKVAGREQLCVCVFVKERGRESEV
jgi:hypothetical protein